MYFYPIYAYSFSILLNSWTHFNDLGSDSVLVTQNKETGKCILFSTHDIDLAIQLSDEMLVMTEGKVVLDQPCNHISSGIFNTLFQDASIQFDASKGRFSFK